MLPSSFLCCPGPGTEHSFCELLTQCDWALRLRNWCWWLPPPLQESEREPRCCCSAEGRLGHWSSCLHWESAALCTHFLAVPILFPEGITELLLEVQESREVRTTNCLRDTRRLLDTQLSTRFMNPGTDNLSSYWSPLWHDIWKARSVQQIPAIPPFIPVLCIMLYGLYFCHSTIFSSLNNCAISSDSSVCKVFEETVIFITSICAFSLGFDEGTLQYFSMLCFFNSSLYYGLSSC